MPVAEEGAEPARKRKVRLPAPLTNLNRAFSLELGDKAHTPSNHAQIRNLWQESGLSVAEFAEVMYQARELTRRYATLRPGEVVSQGQTRNWMPYFFATLRYLLNGDNHDRLAAWDGQVRQENHARSEEKQLDAGKSSRSSYPVVDISDSKKVPTQEEKRVSKGTLTAPFADSNYPAHNRSSQREKTYAKQSFYSGRSSEHGKVQIYDSWLVSAGLKKSGDTSARLAVRG
ncbi:MAG TPA: hypothetical protein VH186_36505 [Chloroflexia bacterium]|nr:hypothetical protein [Chloroflexia bacterium]